MAARKRDDKQMLSVKLVDRASFRKVQAACENPPKPSAELIDLFARRKKFAS